MSLLTKPIKAVAIIISLIFVTNSAFAQFEKSDDKLFIGYLDLATDPQPETEYSAYAIVQVGGENLPVLYVISGNFKGEVFVLGAFRCDKEFEVLKTHSNGMRDIKCVKQDVFGQRTTTLIRFGDEGFYKEIF